MDAKLVANPGPRSSQNWSVEFQSGCPLDLDGLGFDGEWVVPDGLGGFAMGTVCGLGMRRYHGLLCASLSPPVCRVMLLNAFDECVHIPGGDPETGEDLDARLTGFQFADQEPPIENPYLVRFEKGIDSCQWSYEIPVHGGCVRIRKALTIADGVGGCRVEYAIESDLQSSMPVTIELRPLVSMRDFHELNHPGTISTGDFAVDRSDSEFGSSVKITRSGFEPSLELRADGLAWEANPAIWRGISYDHETRRQQGDQEDLLCPGVFSAKVMPNEPTIIEIEARVNGQPEIDWEVCSKAKQARVGSAIEHALASAGNPQEARLYEGIAKLAQSADDFIVRRLSGEERGKAEDSVSVLAGYPWFSDWGRDTMIALPGLFLCTGRFDEAHQTLTTFAGAIEHGLIPNRFDDAGGSSHYNTVDASLWFVHACRQWELATGKGVGQDLIDACDQIINAYIAGTIHGIGLDEADGLITAGDENTQLTWMDALRDGVAFTPRHGKAIEINALWINAIVARTELDASRPELQARVDLARQSLKTKMGVGPGNGLVDCLTNDAPSNELRPNQMFALSLAGVGLPKPMGKRAIEAVAGALLTPVGLRTLDPENPHYYGHYKGSMTDRDRAYHNGTAWPWLLGPYCEAVLRVNDFSESARQEAQAIMLGLVDRMSDDGVGQLFEIYDGDAIDGHHRAHGCPAQAWSISEALRVLVLSCQR